MNTAYMIISGLVLLSSYALFRCVAGNLSIAKLNMISWTFYYSLFVQAFIGSILIINGWDDHYRLRVVGPEARYYGWMAVQYTMVAMPLGMLLVTWASGFKTATGVFERFVSKPIVPVASVRDSYARLVLYTLCAISVFAVMYVFYAMKTIPILEVMSGSEPLLLRAARAEARFEFTGNVYIRNLFAIGLTPLLSYIAFAYWRMTRRKWDLLWFLAMFFFSFLIVTYNIAKAPIILYMLGFLFMKVLIEGRVKRSVVIGTGVVIIVALVGMYIVLSGVVDISRLFALNTGIFARIVLMQSAGMYLSFEVFPSQVPHIGFASVSGVFNDAFGMQSSERSAAILSAIYNPEGVETGTTGVINALFMGEAWANYGLIGALVAPFWVGGLIQALYLTLLRLPKTPIVIGLLVYFSINSAVNGGFNDYLWSVKTILVILLFMGIWTAVLWVREQLAARAVPQ